MIRFSCLVTLTLILTAFTGRDYRPFGGSDSLNGRQVEILQVALFKLQDRIANVKEEIYHLGSKRYPNSWKSYMVDSTVASIKDLTRTEAHFVEAAGNGCQSVFSRVYFQEFMNDYINFVSVCSSSTNEGHFDVEEASKQFIYLLRRNEKGYIMAIQTKKMAFNLQVNSVPILGAKIFMKRAGTEYILTGNTNKLFNELKGAKWYIRIEADGYKSKVDSLDPYNDDRRQLDFILEKDAK